MEGLVRLLLDLLLMTGLLVLAWAALTSKDLRRAVVLFIGFGLLLALVWLRLRAPDIALAEAAIGAGLTGALLLSALRGEPALPAAEAAETGPRGSGLLLTLLTVGLTLALGLAFVHALGQADPVRLMDQVFTQLGSSGVSNPVTGVLLNFRAYDTLLELAVLLTALLGILALGPAQAGYLNPGPVLSGLTRWLLPLLILVSGYLLWVGAHAPGGAFQAGALLAAAGVLLRLAGHDDAGRLRGLALRLLSAAGVGLFLAVGLLLMLNQGVFLQYPPGWAGTLILAIETAATLGIAVTLVLAFLGGEPASWMPPQNAAASPRPPTPSQEEDR
jgi:multisubunit Na+/H+ antiporter MnhB subunit